MANHIPEHELYLYATGESPLPDRVRIMEHLQECGQCQETVREIEQTRQLLRRAAPALLKLHPAPETVIQYLEGQLEGEQATQVQDHLAGCDYCLSTEEILDYTVEKAQAEKAQFVRKYHANDIKTAVWTSFQKQRTIHSDLRDGIHWICERITTVAEGLSRLSGFREFRSEPIRLPGFMPIVTAVEFAAPEGGYEEQRIESAGSPFVLTFYRFVQGYRIHVKTDDPTYQHSLVAIRLLEGPAERACVLVALKDGEGEHPLSEEERILYQPLRENCHIRHQALWPLPDLRAEEKCFVAEQFERLLEHPSAAIRVLLLHVLGEIGLTSSLHAIRSLENDSDELVRKAAHEARQKIESRQP